MQKMARKQIPAGFSAIDFTYQGRPARDQGDFGADVGIADMACVDQFGSSNKAKHYHGGVVKASNGSWWVYLEWGRIKPGLSWDGGRRPQDFQFVRCSGEGEARSFFAKQLRSKNTSRLVQKSIGGKTIWAGRSGKDGYIVQRLATRVRGLPDAYGIKDSSGLSAAAKKKKVTVTTAAKPAGPALPPAQPQVVDLAAALTGGTRDYARAASASTGIVPTMEAIEEVRNDLLPLAMSELARIGDDTRRQIRDSKLIDISKMVAALVPRPIPRSATSEQRAIATILSAENILAVQQDLDAYEAALKNEDFTVVKTTAAARPHPDRMLNAKLTWLDPRGELGRWLEASFRGMTNNRHGYLRGKSMRVKNMFTVARPDRDALFDRAVQSFAASSKVSRYRHKARLQPKARPDAGPLADAFAKANVFLGIHGTRAVNVQPIMSSNLRLPRQLKGVHITGAAFGHGIYFATDYRKSYGYTGHGRAYYGGGGNIRGRAAFMFLNDVIMGDAYMARSTGSWGKAPDRKDSVAAYPDFMRSLQNDEHIIFNAHHQRIRYLIEMDLG